MTAIGVLPFRDFTIAGTTKGVSMKAKTSVKAGPLKAV